MVTRPIKLITDSSADIPDDVLHDLDISVVPLIINLGDQTYEETSLTRDAFWDLANAGPHPTTSQPSIGAFDLVFRSIIERGCDALCLTVTGKHSGTFNAALTAAQAYPQHVHVIDSTYLSMAHGMQVISAAKMASQGHGLAAIRQTLGSLRKRTHMLIQFDATESLRRGGRASRLMPVIERVSRALDIKPILTVIDGELKLWTIVRSHPKGIRRMIDHVASLTDLERLLVMHIRRPHLAQDFADLLAAATGFDRASIQIGEAGAVLACHGGEGVIAVASVTAA